MHSMLILVICKDTCRSGQTTPHVQDRHLQQCILPFPPFEMPKKFSNVIMHIHMRPQIINEKGKGPFSLHIVWPSATLANLELPARHF